MTTRRESLCKTKGCPTRRKDFQGDVNDWHIPWCQDIKGHKCFGGATHQHIPKKGMGGNNPESKIVACLCTGIHDRIDNGDWGNEVLDVPEVGKVYRVHDLHNKTLLERIIEAAPGGPVAILIGKPPVPVTLPGPNASDEELATYLEEHKDDPEEWGDEPTPAIVSPARTHRTRGESFGDKIITWAGETATGPQPPAVLSDKEVSLESVPDEQLAALFAEADKRQAEGFLLKCRIVHAYRERHVQSWGSSWTESAYELFHISRRTLNAYANLHEICDTSDRYLIEQIAPLTDSKSLMTHIGRKNIKDGKVALEAAVAYQAEFAEPPTVKALMHKLGEEAKPPEVCPERVEGPHEWVCEHCGKEK